MYNFQDDIAVPSHYYSTRLKYMFIQFCCDHYINVHDFKKILMYTHYYSKFIFLFNCYKKLNFYSSYS